MPITVTCPECDRDLKVQEKQQGKKIKCPGCSAVLTVPASGTAARQGKAEGYGVTAAAPRCPECDKEVEPKAVICVNCGLNLKTGKRLKTSVKGFDRTWHVGMYLLGLFDTLHLTKDGRGRVRLAITRRFLFIPLSNVTLDLEDFDEVWLGYNQGFGAFGWTVMLVLLLVGVVPGLFWWYWAFNQNNYTLQLGGKRGQEPIALYRGWHEPTMQDVADTLKEVANLSLKRK